MPNKNQFYYTCPTTDLGDPNDPASNFASGITEGKTCIYYGDSAAIIGVERDTDIDILPPEVTRATHKTRKNLEKNTSLTNGVKKIKFDSDIFVKTMISGTTIGV